jgi:hypothetical protein
MGRLGCIICLSLGLFGLTLPNASNAQVICTGNASPPPELPVYDQPPIPAPGYVWTPGYWAVGPNGYYWVPGTWVEPPTVGLLWTPGYWGWRDGIYVWNAGYWGPHVGFYGGINYGFGYSDAGYEGGRWENGAFVYNRTVNNFGSVRITNVYEKTVVIDPGLARVSFNGGSGGTTVRPTPEQEAAAHEQHMAALPTQLQQERMASTNKGLLASENHGQPAIAATAKPGEFTGKGVIAAREEKPVSAPDAKTTGSVGPNKILEKEQTAIKPAPPPHQEQTAIKPAAPAQPRHPEQTAIKPAAPAQPGHPEQTAIKPAPPQPGHPEQTAIKPAPPPHQEHPEQTAIKPAPPPHPEHPEQTAIKPAAPPHPEHPEQTAIKPAAAPPPPQPLAPAAAKPLPPAAKPACPPGKTPAEVNGHPICR